LTNQHLEKPKLCKSIAKTQRLCAQPPVSMLETGGFPTCEQTVKLRANPRFGAQTGGLPRTFESVKNHRQNDESQRSWILDRRAGVS